MLHTYRALRVHQHYDNRFPQEDFLEELEWHAPSLSARTWKDTLLFGLRCYSPKWNRFNIRDYYDDARGAIFVRWWAQIPVVVPVPSGKGMKALTR